MKIKINVDFVVEFSDILDEPVLLAMPAAVRQPFALAAAAHAFENMFQSMLIQVPEMIKAEVMSIEEYVNDPNPED